MKKLTSLLSVVALLLLASALCFNPGDADRKGMVISSAIAGGNNKSECWFKDGCRYRANKSCFGSMACGPKKPKN